MSDEEAPAVFGLDTSEEDCWRIFDRLPKPMIEDERFLFSQKWFDYRKVHSIIATFMFAEAYETAYKETYTRELDHKRGPYVKGLKNRDIFTPLKDAAADRSRLTTLTGIWKSRQHADLMGIPYLFFCRSALKWTMRKSRKYIARPTQLYSFDLLTAISNDWREWIAGRAVVAEDAIFKNENYRGAPIQDAHHDWLLELAAKRENPAPLIYQLLYVDDVLLESKVEHRYGANMLERARSYC